MPISIKRSNTTYDSTNASYDYSNVNPQDLLKDPFFRRDVMDNASSQGMVDFTFEDALSEWYNEQSYAALNELGAVFGDAGYMGATGLEGSARDRMARLTSAYQLMPNVLTTGSGEGSISDELSGLDITKTLAGANVLNPTNLVGGGSAKAAAYGALAAGKSTGKAAIQAGKVGAKSQMLAGAASEGAISVAGQNRDIELGNKTEFSILEASAAVGLGAAANYGIAFLIGAATTPLAKAKLVKNQNLLLKRGFTQTDIDEAATLDGANGIDELLTYGSKSELEAKLAENQPADPEAIVEPEVVPDILSRESLDFDIDRLAQYREELQAKAIDIENPPTSAEKKELDAESRILQMLEDEATDINQILREQATINASIKSGELDPKASAQARMQSQKLADQSRKLITEYKIRNGIYENLTQAETYDMGLEKYKARIALADQKARDAAQVATPKSKEDVPLDSATKPAKVAQAAQPVMDEPVARTSEQQEAADELVGEQIKEAEDDAAFDTLAGLDSLDDVVDDVQPEVNQVKPAVNPDSSFEKALLEVGAVAVEPKLNAKGKVIKVPEVLSARTIAYAKSEKDAKGNPILAEDATPPTTKPELNRVTREVLAKLDPENASKLGGLSLPAKNKQINDIFEKAVIERQNTPAESPAPSPVTIINEAQAPEKPTQPQAAEVAEVAEDSGDLEANEFIKAFDLEAVKEFEVPEKLRKFAAERADPEASNALATLFTSIADSGAEVILRDVKLMKKVVFAIFGNKDGRKIMSEYRKVWAEANPEKPLEVFDEVESVTFSAEVKPDNFEREFVNQYVAARKKRVTTAVRDKFSGFWNEEQNRFELVNIDKSFVNGWKADARKILRDQYSIRGASLDHWEMFSNIKSNKAASEAYIKSALRGELKPRTRSEGLDDGIVLSESMAITHAKKNKVPVAFIATRQITNTKGFGVTLADGYSHKKNKNGTRAIEAGSIVFYSPYAEKQGFFQSVRDLLVATGRISADDRDNLDVSKFIDVKDFTNRKKILGTGFKRLLDAYEVVHTQRKGKPAPPFNKDHAMKNFIVSRFLLQQELDKRAGSSFFELAKKNYEAAEVPAPKLTTKPKTPKKEQATLDEPAIPKGYRLALLSASGRKIRVISDYQLDKGDGINELYGNASRDDWEAGLVPVESPKANDSNFEKLVDMYQPMAEQPVRKMFTDVAPNIEFLKDFKAVNFLSEDELSLIKTTFHKVMGARASDDLGMHDIAQMATQIDNAIRVKDGELDESIKLIKGVLSIQKRYFPQGVGRTTQARKTAVWQAANVMAGFKPDEKRTVSEMTSALAEGDYKAVETLMRRMTGAVDKLSPHMGAPTFKREHDLIAGSHTTNRDGLSVIGMRSEAKQMMPQFGVLLHEVAHWAYVNAMTPQMRMDFWDEIKSAVYTEGKVDPDKLAKTTGFSRDNEASINQVKNMQLDGDNFSPQEFFANAFSKWALNNRHSEYLNISYWEKLSSFVHGLFQKMQGKESGSPKLDAMFAQLYPENTAANRQAKKFVEVFSPKTPPKHVIDAEDTYQFILRSRLIEMEESWDTFSASLNDTGTPAGTKAANIVFDARVMANNLNSIAMTRAESRQLSFYGLEAAPILDIGKGGTNKTGALSVLSQAKLAGKMRVLARELNTIVAREVSGNVNQSAVADEPFDIARYEFISDHYADGKELDDSMRADILKFGESVLDEDVLNQVEAEEIFDDIDSFLQTRLTESEGFNDETMTISANRTDPLDTKESARQITELMEKSSKLIDDAGQALADRYYKLSDQNYAIRVPSDKSLKASAWGGRGPMGETQRNIIAGANARNNAKKNKTNPVSKTKMVYDDSLQSLDRVGLAAKHQEVIDSGDLEAAEAVYNEAYRRSVADSPHRLSGDMAIKSSQVQSAIDVENISKFDDEGVWSDAPLTIRDGARMMTHRDPEVQANMRLMFQRMYGLINASTRGIVDDIPLIDTHTLGKITGETFTSKDGGAVQDLSTAKFGALRSDFRRIVIALNRDDSDPKNLMHEIGHVFKRALPHEDLLVIKGAFEKAVEAKDPVAVEFTKRYKNKRNSDLAEEWFVESWANYLANRVSKENIISSTLDYSARKELKDEMFAVKGSLGKYLDLMSEYVMYGLNGLIGRNDVKQMFRRLTFSGDLIKRQTILGNISKQHIHSDYLKDFAQQALSDLPQEGVVNMQKFVRGSISSMGGRILPLYYATTGRMTDSVLPNNFMGKKRLSGAVYVADSPQIAQNVFTDPKFKAQPYNKKEVVDAVSRLSELDGTDPNISTNSALNQLARLESIIGLRHKYIAESIRLKDALDDPSLANKAEDNRVAYNETTQSLESLNNEITETVEIFEARLGISPVEHNAVLVSSVAEHEVISFSARTPLNETNRGTFGDLLTLITPNMKQEDYVLLASRLDSAPTAAQAFEVLSDVSGSDVSLPKALKDLNYKAALITADSGEDITAILVPEQIKRINDTEFTNPEVVPMLNETATLRTITGEMLISKSASAEGESLKPSAVAQAIASMIEKNGSNGATADTISQITRGYVGRGEQAKKFLGGFKGTFNRLLTENSVQIRNGGMNWLGNLIKPENGVGHYEKHGSRVGKKVMPILNLIESINDPEKGAGRRYLDRVNQWGYKPSKGEAKVLKAMRRPDGNVYEARLKGDERKLYDLLRSQFKSELDEMRSQGLFVGNIKNYVPQVWDVNMINKDAASQKQFAVSLASYFKSEARNRGDVLPDIEADQRAVKMMARLSDDDGVYIPSRAKNQTDSKSDHFDFSRVIRLDEFPDHLDELEGFLVNDLGGLTTKYFNESSRRILLTKDFGIESHAFYDYMETHENGIKGAAKLLSSGKVYRRAMESFDGEVVTTLEHQIMMPIARSEDHAMKLIEEAVSIMDTSGLPAAKEHLMSLAIKRQPALERRVESILTALSETGGKPSSTTTDYKHAYGMFDTLRGRSPSRGGIYNESARKLSKNFRMFNSVSLLSYTVVTSMTDLVLPIIRSGSIASAMKGLKKVNADPDYREAIRNVGAGMSSIAHNKLVHMSGGEGDKLSNAFFSGIGLNQWTEYMRDYAASTAYEAIKAEQRIAIRSIRGDGTDMSKQGADFRRAKRFLARVGLGNFAEAGAESLDNMKLLENDQVREAIHRMTNEAVFAPNGNDIPLIWQSPLGSVLFQFKSFPLMMGRLARRALWDEAGKPMLTKGEPINIAPAAMLLTLAPIFGEQVLSLRDTITAKGGEEGGEYKRRERSANKFLESFGADEDDPVFKSDQVDALAGRYVEGFMYAGGFGLLADLFHQSAEQIDNGAYGSNRIASTFLGPTYGTVFGTAVNVLAGATDTNEDSNSKERQAWREIIGRIPLVGQNRQIKEDAVNYLGGEATR